ncbi:MAG: A/G-specific adenine glycosylase [Planctomycetes bacterium]|nr:A/G-specific adenine glycosylase [Planctomycetota bacterium]
MPLEVSASAARALRRELVAWYRRARRDLPWRRTRDPYAIWISEAMLQQTRVETVVDYWQRFLARFPDAAALASAPEDEVLGAWSGLGYYRRARNLQAAARAIVERHAGLFPSGADAVRELPGVGPYTAGAVLSIAFDAPAPLVDGNVARVFARLFELDAPIGSKVLERELWSLARTLVPARGAGEWNQALMELGATLCTPRKPRCADCPLARRCRARAAGRVDELPRPKARRATIEVELEILWIERGERVLLARRPDVGRMAGMLELPTIERAAREEGLLHPTRHSEGAAFRAAEPLLELRHTITHHRIRASVFAGRTSARVLPRPYAWHARRELRSLPLTGLSKKVLRALDS